MARCVGIIGLGIMGGAFARNLVAGGWQVIGYDVAAERISEAREAGVEIAPSAAALAEAALDIILSLPTPQAALASVQAIAEAKVSARTVIEAGTFTLADKLAVAALLEAAGHTALDCPISGTGAQAKTKDLVVYASGGRGEIARLEPLFLGFARKAYDLGTYGNGSKMKFVANHLVAIHNVASAEAMVLAIKAGLDPHQVVEVIGSGAGSSRIFELRAPMMANNRYLPATMRSSTWKKDLTVIGGFASDLDCPTPMFDLSCALHGEVLAAGRGEEDTAVVCEILAGKAGLKR